MALSEGDHRTSLVKVSVNTEDHCNFTCRDAIIVTMAQTFPEETTSSFIFCLQSATNPDKAVTQQTQTSKNIYLTLVN